MKKLLATILALVMALGLCTAAWAENEEVKGVGTADALAAAVAAGGKIKLTENITLTSTLEITNGKNVTIDLNGNTVTSSLSTAIKVSNGYLTVKNTANTSGKISATGEAFHLAGNTDATTWATTSTPAELVIMKGVEVESESDCCIFMYGKGAKADVAGKLTSKGQYATIQGQGTISATKNNGGTEIIIRDDAEISQSNPDDRVAIYHPQIGTLTVTGGTVTGGASAIEIRRGTLIISGGVLASTSTTYACAPNITPTNGSTMSGVAVAVAPHGAVGDLGSELSVNVSGGTFKGIYGFGQGDPDNYAKNNTVKVNLKVTAGDFTSTGTCVIEGTTYGGAIFSEQCTNFVSGGTFSNSVDPTYLADGLKYEVCAGGKYSYYSDFDSAAAAAAAGRDEVIKVGNSNTGVVPFHIDYADGTGVKPALRISKDNFELPTPTRSGYTFKGWKIALHGGEQIPGFNGTYTSEQVKDIVFAEVATDGGIANNRFSDGAYLTAVWSANSYYYYPSTSDTTTSTTTKGSPKTFDAGVGIYAVTALLSVTGMAWTAKKRH